MLADSSSTLEKLNRKGIPFFGSKIAIPTPWDDKVYLFLAQKVQPLPRGMTCSP